ncbi:MAG: flagellar basal body-associated protein FliL [Ketobacteraceae bacterium]|nr:flagellar basal body-associated protein FliL [Ketobacteraceae bacterium]
MADDEEQKGTEEKPKSKMMLIIIIAVLVALLVGGGVAAFFLMSGGDEAASEDEAALAEAPAIYYELKPPFVVNYTWKGRQRYVQIGVAIMTRNEAVIGAIQKHMPLVRNNLVMLFGSQEFEGLRSMEGKEALRQKALEEIQAIVTEEMGEGGVEKVLFTNFVMQ